MALKTVTAPFPKGKEVLFVSGFTRNNEIVMSSKSKKYFMSADSWGDTFPSSLLLMGDPVIRHSNGMFKRFNILGDSTEIALNTLPAIVAYSQEKKGLIFAYLLNGTMIKLDAKLLPRKLHPGEPIIITETKSQLATKFEVNTTRAFIDIIKVESESKLDSIDSSSNLLDSRRLQGAINYVAHDKGIAFIKSEEGKYFLHSTNLLRANFDKLKLGDLLEFSVEPAPEDKKFDLAVNAVLQNGQSYSKKLSLAKQPLSSHKDKLIKDSFFHPQRKRGEILTKNNSLLKIRSGNNVYTALRADVHRASWSKIKADASVWFTVSNRKNLKNKKATNVSMKK